MLARTDRRAGRAGRAGRADAGGGGEGTAGARGGGGAGAAGAGVSRPRAAGRAVQCVCPRPSASVLRAGAAPAAGEIAGGAGARLVPAGSCARPLTSMASAARAGTGGGRGPTGGAAPGEGAGASEPRQAPRPARNVGSGLGPREVGGARDVTPAAPPRVPRRVSKPAAWPDPRASCTPPTPGRTQGKSSLHDDRGAAKWTHMGWALNHLDP
uniref:Spidroin-1-like n=1 Tax=Castor canadensis TaxID=51338 RepID=A0A8B7VUM8_CASCN|nr:spidroin-1-like [Castor canadensis]